MRRIALAAFPLLFAATLLPGPAGAQVGIGLLELPPSGDNQKAAVSQWIGLVEVGIRYSSPDVTGPNGEDRRGKIWGQLVPYGLANLGFGPCGDQCPWRAGANENTVFTVSHEVEIEGLRLAAGSYGLHMIPGEEEWTLIFSTDHTSWGSFFYDPAEDALRVKVKPKKAPYTHWLTYEFTDRQPAQATAALRWEELEIAWTIKVPDPVGLYVARLREQLRNAQGFSHIGWAGAALYCLQNGVNLEEAERWAQASVDAPFVGQETLLTLGTLGQLQAANGKAEEAAKTLVRAAEHPSANAFQVHALGRQLIAAGRPELSLAIFQANHDRHGGAWPTKTGLARAYSALGQHAKALEYARQALEQAPDDANRQALEQGIQLLEQGKDFN